MQQIIFVWSINNPRGRNSVAYPFSPRILFAKVNLPWVRSAMVSPPSALKLDKTHNVWTHSIKSPPRAKKRKNFPYWQQQSSDRPQLFIWGLPVSSWWGKLFRLGLLWGLTFLRYIGSIPLSLFRVCHTPTIRSTNVCKRVFFVPLMYLITLLTYKHNTPPNLSKRGAALSSLKDHINDVKNNDKPVDN